MNKPNRVTAKQIKACLAKRHSDDISYDEVNMSSGGSRRIDYLAVKKTWSPITFVGYEIKVSRQDFLNDTKWHEYLNCCHLFSFAAPKGLISADELPPQIGLVEYNPERKTIRTKRKPIYRQIPHGEYLVNILLHILMWKVDRYKTEYYVPAKDKAKAWEDWLETSEYNYKIGNKVSRKISELMREENRRIRDNNFALKEWEEVKTAYRNIDGRFGHVSSYEIIQLMESNVKRLPAADRKIINDLDTAFDAVKRIRASLEDKKLEETNL